MTLDGIYLYPASNFQGVHQIMYLRTGKLIKMPKLFEIPITGSVINNVEKMLKEQGFKLLKFYN